MRFPKPAVTKLATASGSQALFPSLRDELDRALASSLADKLNDQILSASIVTLLGELLNEKIKAE